MILSSKLAPDNPALLCTTTVMQLMNCHGGHKNYDFFVFVFFHKIGLYVFPGDINTTFSQHFNWPDRLAGVPVDFESLVFFGTFFVIFRL